MTLLPPVTPMTFPYYPDKALLDDLDIPLQMISEYYMDDRAKRSKVPKMNHIWEGLAILNFLQTENPDNPRVDAMAAFCIHPLIQADADFKENFTWVAKNVDSYIMGLAVEYRSVANEYLSHREIRDIREIRLSASSEVNDMLIADKVQNYKDFMKYRYGTHPRSAELDQYFKNWITKLDAWFYWEEFKDR